MKLIIRYAIILLGFAILAVATTTLYSLLTQGHLMLSSSADNLSVTVQNLNGQVVAQRSGFSKGSIALNPDVYRVSVKEKDHQLVKYVQIAARESKSIAFEKADLLNVSLSAQNPAFNVLRQGQSLAYFNPLTRHIESIDGSNNTQAIDLSAIPPNDPSSTLDGSVKNMQLTAGNEAIAVAKGKLYLIGQNGVVSPISMEGMPQFVQPGSILIGTNPQMHSFVASIGSVLYFYQSAQSKPQKITDLSKKFDQLALGGTSAIAYSTALPESKDDVKSQFGLYAIDPVVVDLTNSSQRTVAGPITNATISPDGKYSIVSPRGLPHNSLLSMTNLKEVALCDTPSLASPLWIDSDNFVFEKDYLIWKYNITANSSITVGQLLDNKHATSISSQGNNSYYVTTFEGNDQASIIRLSGEAPNSSAVAAASATPYQSTNFVIKYANITQPSIIIQTGVSVKDPSQLDYYKQATLTARNDALNYLQSKGVDTSKIKIIFDPADPLQL